MIRFILYAFILLVAIILEATFIEAPLTLAALFIIGVLEKRGWILFVGFAAGLVLDSLTFRLIGESSLFFLGVLFVLYLYGRKFEIQNIVFDAFFCFIASSIYGILFGNQQPFIGAVIVSIFVGGIITLFQFFEKGKQRIYT